MYSVPLLSQQEPPPKEEEVEIDGVKVLELAKDVRVLRGICSKRLKFDIEFSRKRGTTDNIYLVKVSTRKAVIRRAKKPHPKHSIARLPRRDLQIILLVSCQLQGHQSVYGIIKSVVASKQMM